MATRKRRTTVDVALSFLRDATAPRNSKAHALDLLDASLKRYGLVELITVDDRTGKIISGHGRRDALAVMHDAEVEPPDGVRVRKADGEWMVPVVQGWASEDDDEAIAAGIDLNMTGERGGWNYEALLTDLDTLKAGDRLAVSFAERDFDELRTRLASESAKGAESSGGALLSMADVGYGEPSVQPDAGSVWRLGPHTLVVADVMLDHATWAPLLTDGCAFAPYPGPYVPLLERAATITLLMVQPDPYIAGHVIDKWNAHHDDDPAVPA